MIIELWAKHSGPVCTPRGYGRYIGAAQTNAYLVTARSWHRNFRPKHFTMAGAAEYDYDPRAGAAGNPRELFWDSYVGHKRDPAPEGVGHLKPLVYSGESERATKVAQFKATRKYASVQMEGDNIGLRNPHSQIDTADELTRTTTPEVLHLEKVFDRVAEYHFRTVSEITVKKLV